MRKVFTVIVTLVLVGLMADSSSGFRTSLGEAAEYGDINALKGLLNKGVDVNERDEHGWPPLMLAAGEGKTEIVKLLIDKGADINAKNHVGYTALGWALFKGHIEIVKLLISKGADIDEAVSMFEMFIIKYPANVSSYKQAIALLERMKPKKEIVNQPIIPFQKPSQEISPVLKSDVDELPIIGNEQRVFREKDLAVVIGIENYQGLPKSDFSKSDAVMVRDYLKALGFQERNIEFITNEKATKSSIEKSLEAWLKNKTKPDSRVFVYYSGHGAPDPKTGNAYIVPFDGDPNYLEVTGYPLKRLYDNLGKLQVAEVVVVLDSCFSGAGGRSVLAKGARPLVMMTTSTALPQNMAVLSATQGTQISTSSTEKGHGVFTYYFLKAIKDGKKTLAEIYEYIKPNVEDEAKQLNVQQSPSISPDAEKIKGRFLLRR